MKRWAMLLSVAVAWSGTAWGAGNQSLGTDEERYSYAFGVQIAKSLRVDGPALNVDALALAIKDVMGGQALRLSPEQMQAAVQVYQERMVSARQEKASTNLKAGAQFMAKNRAQDGVQETASGLQYSVEEAGTGRQPTLEDTVEVHYRGTLISGEEFDSSYRRGEPVSFPVSGVIPGWQEALTLMKEGAKWHVVIPSALAYGEQGAGGSIGPNETLVFDIELLKVQ